MFSVGYFLRLVTVSDYLSCKYSNIGKPNVIKQLNIENKSLYGGLLETKKQRRKTVATVINEKSGIENNLEASPSNKNEDLNDPKISKKMTRKPRLKLNSTPSLSPLLNVPNVTAETVPICTSDESEPLKSKNASKNSKVYHSNKNNSSQSHNEFVFKSIVLINESNYPLENVDKNTSCNLATKAILNYNLSDSVVKQYLTFPSVSKIMENTMSDKNKIILTKWRQNMIRDMGEEGFSKHCEDLKSRGHDFHSAVCDTVLGRSRKDYSEVTQNALKSLAWMLEHVSNPLAVESVTAHPLLEYKGIPDCVLHFRGLPVVVDWKLSEKPKKDLKDTYEAPVQITAYIGALNHDPNYKWVVNHGLVAVAYTNGDPCDVFLLAPEHCNIYWRHWLARCDKFKARSHLHTNHIIDEKTLI